MKMRFSFWQCFGILAAVALLIYARHLSNDFIDIDDDRFITANPLITTPSFSGLLHAFSAPVQLLYIPLTIALWQIASAIAGIHPFVFHLLNIALHSANALLVFLILDRLTEWKTGAFFGALLFCVHPLNAEAVLWAAQTKDLLSAGFVLLSALFYIRFAQEYQSRLLGFSILFYAIALFAKVGGITLPITLLFLDWLSGRQMNKAVWIEKIPCIVLAIIFSIIGARSGAQFLAPIGFFTMLLLAIKGTGYILLHFFFPVTLSPLLFQGSTISFSDPGVVTSLLSIVVITVASSLLVWKKKAPVIVFGIVWFALLLAPTFAAAEKAGLLFYTSEKYAYLPMLGLILVCVAGIKTFIERSQNFRTTALYVGCLVIALFALRTHLYGYAWASSDTLYTQVLKDDPKNPVALSGAGFRASAKGDYDAALKYYADARTADPDNIVNYSNAAGALKAQGKTKEMVEVLRQMLPHMTRRQLAGDLGSQQLVTFLSTQVLSIYDPKLGEEMQKKLYELVPELKK